MSGFLIAVLSVGVILGFMILIHEFGHYATAKLLGVRVEVFSIGFGKRLFGFRRGETDFRFSLILFGGYVKMTGEQPGDEEDIKGHPFVGPAGRLFDKALAEAGANVIVTACPFCMVNIEDAIKVAGMEGKMTAIDLAELADQHIVAREMPNEIETAVQGD